MDKIIFDSRKNTFQPLRVFGILFCLIVLTAGLAGTACAEGWGSDYDSVSSLTIDSAANLTAFSQLVNSGKDFTGKTVNLANDIDLGDAEWTPIGNETHAFNGTFFGGNHKITGLNVTGDIRYAGLFGNVTGAVKNLNVDGNITVSREGDDTPFVGGIAGLNGGSIEYCTFKGDIKVSSNTGSVYAGGVVGSSSMTVTGCTFEGSITVKGNGIVYAGGVVGFNDVTVSKCASKGSITVSGSGGDSVYVYVGGITGENEGAVQNSYSTSDIKVICDNNEIRVGGITGENSGPAPISNCYATGDVTAKSANNVYAGGVAGRNFVASITNCYATGGVTAESANNVYAGGVVGHNFNLGFILNCSALNKGISASGSSTDVHVSTIAYNSADPDSQPGTVSGYYWSGLSVENINGEPLTADEIWDKEFSGFDYTDVWQTGTSENFRLPVLKSLGEPEGADASHLIPVHIISFAGEGMDELKVEYGKSVTLPENKLTNTGYLFSNWNTAEDMTGTSYADKAEIYFVDVPADGLTLFANWTPITYKVNFEANGAESEGVVEQEFIYDVPQKLTKNSFIAPSGKVFAGWNTKADGSGKSYADEAEVMNLCDENGETINLYAQWKNAPSGNGGGSPKPSKPIEPETPEEPSEPGIILPSETVIEDTKEIIVSEETTEVLETGETVTVVELENTEVVQSVAVSEEIAKENPEASVQITEGNKETVLLPGDITTEEVHVIVDLAIVDKQGNPVEIKSSGYFILDADVPTGKKLAVGHYKNGIWEDCKVEDIGNGHYKVHYSSLSPFAAIFIEEHEETPFAAAEKPTEEPQTPDTPESPMPILAVLAGLSAAVILRRK